MRTTLLDIAGEAGVSLMTVSNVLRNRSGKTSEQTRRKVLAAASKMRYVPVQSGRQNSHVKTSVIGLLERNFMQVQHPVRTITFDGIQAGAAEMGYDITLLLRPQPSWIMDIHEATFLDRRVDGFIIRNPIDLAVMGDAIALADMPCVACNTDSPPHGVGSVTIDNRAAIRDAVSHLTAKGHRRIGHITDGEHPDGIARLAAFRECVAEFGLEPSRQAIVTGHWGTRDEIVGIHEMLAAGVTSVVCGNDYQALQLWDAATAAGIAVPGELSIVGIDDIEESRYRGLTTIAAPFLEVGRAAVGLLVEIIEKRNIEYWVRTIPGRLVERESVAPPRRNG